MEVFFTKCACNKQKIVPREDDNAVQPIASMPGVSRYGNNKLKEFLEPLVNMGLSSVLLFGVMDNTPKVSTGHCNKSRWSLM